MKAILIGLFGGGSSLIYVMLAALIGACYLEYKDAKSDAVQMEQERDEWKSTALGNQSAIITLSQQSARKTTHQKENENAVQTIHAVPDARHCAASDPIRASLDWVSDYRARRAQTHPHPTNVSMSDQAGYTGFTEPR